MAPCGSMPEAVTSIRNTVYEVSDADGKVDYEVSDADGEVETSA